MEGAVQSPTRWCPRYHASATQPTGYTQSAREESAMAGCAIHNSFASCRRSPRVSDAARARMVAPNARWAATAAPAAARPVPCSPAALPHYSSPFSPPLLVVVLAVVRPDAGVVDSDSSVPRLGASAATKTSAAPSLHSALHVSPASRIAGGFHCSLIGPEIAAGLELSQAARPTCCVQPLFWRHIGTLFGSYHS